MTDSATPPPVGREFYREQLRDCCGEHGTPEGGFCETFGCTSVVDLLAMVDAAEQESSLLDDALEQMSEVVQRALAQTREAIAERDAAERRAAEAEEAVAEARPIMQALVDRSVNVLADHAAAARENERLRGVLEQTREILGLVRDTAKRCSNESCTTRDCRMYHSARDCLASLDALAAEPREPSGYSK